VNLPLQRGAVPATLRLQFDVVRDFCPPSLRRDAEVATLDGELERTTSKSPFLPGTRCCNLFSSKSAHGRVNLFSPPLIVSLPVASAAWRLHPSYVLRLATSKTISGNFATFIHISPAMFLHRWIATCIVFAATTIFPVVVAGFPDQIDHARDAIGPCR